MPVRKMHQTTVRFGADLWEALEKECETLGLSVAQYVREAALVRLSYAAAKRGDHAFEAAFERIGNRPEQSPAVAAELLRAAAPLDRVEGSEAGEASSTRPTPMQRAQVEVSESSALVAQGRQVRARAKAVREQIARRRLPG